MGVGVGQGLRCGAVRCGAVRCGAVRCDLVVDPRREDIRLVGRDGECEHVGLVRAEALHERAVPAVDEGHVPRAVACEGEGEGEG